MSSLSSSFSVSASDSSLSRFQRIVIGLLAVVAVMQLVALYQVTQGQVQSARARAEQERADVQAAAETRAQRARLTAAFAEAGSVQSVGYTLAR